MYVQIHPRQPGSGVLGITAVTLCGYSLACREDSGTWNRNRHGAPEIRWRNGIAIPHTEVCLASL